VTFASGKINQAGSFDGSSNFIEISDSKEISGGQSFTLAAWIYRNSTGSRHDFLNKFFDGAMKDYGLGTNTDTLWFYLENGGGNDFSLNGSTTLNSGTWYHVLATYNHSKKEVKLYVNGSLDASGTSSFRSPNTDAPLTIGAMSDTSTYNNSNYMDGLMDEVRVYNRALSQPEIKALYNLSSPSGKEITEADVPSSQDSGISRYKFNGDVTDSWGSNDGTDNTSAGYVNGVYGQAKDFDGSDDTITDIGPITLGSMWSVSCWYKPNSFTDYGHIFTSQSSQYNFACKVDQNGNPYFYTSSSGSLNTGFQLNSNEWHHLVYQYDGSKIEIYINADLKLSESASLDISSDTYRVQGGGGGEYVEAAHDDLRIYDRTLSPLEVEKLFHLGARRINRKEVLH
jgi:hypothetical protein